MIKLTLPCKGVPYYASKSRIQRISNLLKKRVYIMSELDVDALKLQIIPKLQESVTGAKKANLGKPRMSLLPAGPLIEVAKVLTLGAELYGDHNWRKGMAYSAHLDAALRHIFKFIDGQDNDLDSKLPHLAHAVADLLFVLEYILTNTGYDDRHKRG